MNNTPDPLDQIRAGFFVECEDLLESLTDAIAAPDFSAGGEPVNIAFRAVHSIKGGASSFAMTALADFAHGLENHLEELRSGATSATAAMLGDLMRAVDHLAKLIAAAKSGAVLPAAPGPLAQLNAALNRPTAPDPDGAPWDIRFRPSAELYQSGNEPLHLLNALADLGACQISCDFSALPCIGELEAESGWLAWQISLPPEISETAIREVFDFVEDICDLRIARRHTPVPTPEVASDRPPAGPEAATMRVALERIDELMSLVGELVISQSMLVQTLPKAAPHSPAAMAVEALGGLTRDLQDAVMAIRTQPIKPLFQRMGRIMREAAATLGKPAELKCRGEATEVDRRIIERLAEPLTHMIRNAVDHGLEDPRARAAAGKPESGTLTLSASNRSGRVIIELSDDGGGIDRDKVHKIALKKGLIAPDTTPSPAEVDALLFHPGFSTADAVSLMSGRGVGLDVVRTAITDLGGRISVQSTPGHGTSFTVSLPLTLAVMDTMVVRAGGQKFIIPLAAILETAAMNSASIADDGHGARLIRLRDRLSPVSDLAAMLGFGNDAQDGGIVILINDEDDNRAALRVDDVIEQRQVVVKALRENCGEVPGIASATILGDGRVALILDPAELIAMANAPRPMQEAS
jgi:two-component system, chemotaxis family, sensor kinase CheA